MVIPEGNQDHSNSVGAPNQDSQQTEVVQTAEVGATAVNSVISNFNDTAPEVANSLGLVSSQMEANVTDARQVAGSLSRIIEELTIEKRSLRAQVDELKDTVAGLARTVTELVEALNPQKLDDLRAHTAAMSYGNMDAIAQHTHELRESGSRSRGGW